jgi:hypothetical protein
MTFDNPGFDPKEIENMRDAIKQSEHNYITVPSEDNNDDYQHFRFVGKYEAKDVVYDAVIYTLKLHHASEVYEMAEHKAAQKFPNFKPIKFQEDENGDLASLDDIEEEIGLYIAEMIDDLEEDEIVKVMEHVDMDSGCEYGVGLDIGLNADEVTPSVIDKFIQDFNEDTISLDETLYSFQSNEEVDLDD